MIRGLLVACSVVTLGLESRRRRVVRPPRAVQDAADAAQMTNKQAVVETTAGTFVIDLRPDLAPNHVGYFMKLAAEGAYDGHDLPSRR